MLTISGTRKTTKKCKVPYGKRDKTKKVTLIAKEVNPGENPQGGTNDQRRCSSDEG